MRYSDYMDHLEALRQKICCLRLEISEIQRLNEQYLLQDRDTPEAHVAYGERHERLQAIQQELAQLAGLGRKVRSIEEMKAKHSSRPFLVKRVS